MRLLILTRLIAVLHFCSDFSATSTSFFLSVLPSAKLSDTTFKLRLPRRNTKPGKSKLQVGEMEIRMDYPDIRDRNSTSRLLSDDKEWHEPAAIG